MRLSGREVTPEVAIMAGTRRPVRLRTGVLTYMLTPAEAIDLATQLADAVTQVKEQENRP
jgi:hypothetical protein